MPGQVPHLSERNKQELNILPGSFRIHPLVLRALALDLLQALEFRGTHSAVFRFPLVVGRLANAVLAADLPRLLSRLGLFQNCDDLRRSLRQAHRVRPSLRPRPGSSFPIRCQIAREATSAAWILDLTSKKDYLELNFRR